jgi:LacI family transcriptional regulator
LLNSKENPAREQMLLSVLDEAQVDGVLLCSSRLPDDKLIPLLSKQKTAVLVNRCLQNQAFSSICIDDYDGAIQALNHLFSLGRRTIGFVCGPPQSYAGHNRMKGYRQALLQAGIPTDPSLSIACEPTVEDGREATLSLLSSQPNIDGLLCYNDLIAIGAIQACREIGVSVPDQVAVIGFDDILLGRVMTPALTTLHVSKLQVGARALQLLMNQIRGQNPVENVLVKEELIIRESAA